MSEPLDFLVVDDDPLMRELVETLLGAAGHRVASVSTGEAALEAVAASPPDCVLVDIMMPGMDGLELCRRLREAPAAGATRVVMLSAKAYEFDRRRARELGADGYIVKPIAADTFVDQVMRLLEDRVEIGYWGVRGTLPVPGEGSLRYGGNTSCVTMRFQNGEFFIFDAGSGIKPLGSHLLSGGKRRLTARIFISHPHWDHINALPFFVPLYVQGNEFEICGPAHGDASMRELISAQMDGIYFPITIREFAARVYFRDLAQGRYDFNGVSVDTMLLSHPGNCLGYRVGYRGRSVCYVTDNELYLPDSEFHSEAYVRQLADFVRGADVLITDTTYTDDEYRTKVGWGHSCVSRVVDLAARAEVKALHLFHHDPDQDDDAIDAKLQTARELLDERGAGIRCEAPAEGSTLEL